MKKLYFFHNFDLVKAEVFVSLKLKKDYSLNLFRAEKIAENLSEEVELFNMIYRD